MADKLPLLPDKDAVCADVKSVLQEVFRDSNYLPKVVEDNSDWVEKLSEDNKVLNNQELKLRDEHAKRLSKEPLTNIYRLHSPRILQNDHHSKGKKLVGLIGRKDLKPTLKQDASGDNNLWVRNILNGSSGNLATIKVTGSKIHPPTPLQISDDSSLQSISWGPVRQISPAPSPSSASATPVPDYIICIPSQLKFLNFDIGRLHTHTLRLINVSKFEMRVSVRPPKRPELDVELCSRLVVTSGSAAEIKIHFRPQDVRELSDQLFVRVSSGQKLIIPIVCYMEPPTLNIIYPPGSLQLSLPEYTKTVSDVLDLGARLLGDVHQTPFVLKCGERHSSFFLLSEDAWLEYSIEVAIGTRDNIPMYGVVADRFFLTPVRWCGGGTVQGLALCRADTPGLHTASLRILCSTAIVRPLHLVADALLFSPKHITLKAQDKDYDICSEDDPACEYYVHLGTSFPNESLSATVTICNHSSLSYNYQWSVRPWGVCSCWDPSYYQEGEDNDSDLCPGALRTKQEMKTEMDNKQAEGDPSSTVHVEPPQGRLEPRRHIELCVRVPDAGGTPGLRRAVLMLILTDIPKESFPADYNPMIVSINVLHEEAIPGVSKSWSREVCDVVCAEMEVWWTVVPVRFALDPPLLLLPHSRRIKSVTIKLRATQLCGMSSVKAHFEMMTPPPGPPRLTPGRAHFISATLPLTELPNEFPDTSYIRLRSEQSAWCVSCAVSRWCSERAPGLRPTRCWLGVLPPGVAVRTELAVLNDTHQHIHWWGACHRWYRERAVSLACEGRPPCVDCCSRSCTCLLLTPSRGALRHKQRITLHYQANAPDSDGCVSTLVQVRRTAPDTSSVQSVPGSAARASLVTYRVLAPRIVLSVLPCGGDKRTECVGCALDSSSTAVLRPRSALTVGDTSCCRLRITNTTPIPTHVSWEPALEEKDALRIVFIPDEFELGGYSQVTVMVTLEAKSVVRRRLFVRRAHVLHSYKPLYLLIDAAVSGVEVSVEFPIGGGEHTDSFVSIKMLQKENIAANITIRKPQSPSVTEMFAEYDRKRVFQKENTCTCKYEMVFIQPKKEPQPPTRDTEDSPAVEIVEAPPALTRVCPCSGQCKPRVPEDVEPYCIQFVGLPLRNVRSRPVTLRNTSRLHARWSCAVRRHKRPRHRTVHTREEDQWSETVHHPGYSLACSPSHGTLAANTSACFSVSVFADTWGLYYDQIIILIEQLEPLVIDVWVEVVGSPLSFALRTRDSPWPVLWISHSDPERLVNITNTSRADLTVYPYIIKENEFKQQDLPFRLYLRLVDVLPRVCPCLSAFSCVLDFFEYLSRSFIEEEVSEQSMYEEEMDTGVELYLAPDFGIQDDSFYQVEPLQLSIKEGESASLTIRSLPHHEVAPYSTLMLRSLPVKECGVAWYRPPPPVQCVALREAERHSDLRITHSEIQVTLCALDLPPDDIMRVRKMVKLQNTGEGPLETTAKTGAPWLLGLSRHMCKAHCIEGDRTKSESITVQMPPRSCIEMVVELSLKTNDVWPSQGSVYPSRTITRTELCFSDHEAVMLLSLPLVLHMDMPILETEPEVIDFGFVSDNTSRKSYFTVKHSSPSAVIELATSWSGDRQFDLWPSSLSLPPGVSERVYLQFTANWMEGAVSCGEAVIRSRGAGGEWCRTTVRARACVARTTSHVHDDHTDDVNLLPS